jgi:hypothetical protein
MHQTCAFPPKFKVMLLVEQSIYKYGDEEENMKNMLLIRTFNPLGF